MFETIAENVERALISASLAAQNVIVCEEHGLGKNIALICVWSRSRSCSMRSRHKALCDMLIEVTLVIPHVTVMPLVGNASAVPVEIAPEKMQAIINHSTSYLTK